MTPKLQIILDQVQQAEKLSAEEKETLKKAILDADKSQAMVQFKLDRIEKDRNTLSIMLLRFVLPWPVLRLFADPKNGYRFFQIQ